MNSLALEELEWLYDKLGMTTEINNGRVTNIMAEEDK